MELQQKRSERVILLLDLDCFYAQCECVRLGLDARTTSLALLQWNSVLAVTYPARKCYGVKRGDSWDAIKQKVRAKNKTKEDQQSEPGTCYAVHVPILTTDPTTTTSTVEETADTSQSSILDADYESIFQLSPDQQAKARKRDLGVRRYSHEGKACIERYRVASARIFRTVMDWIQESGFSDEIVLERASIDEFFLDVTAACQSEKIDIPSGGISVSEAVNDTVVIGPQHPHGGSQLKSELERGCWIARSIRKTIFDKLGFTLSSGISINKTIAKLSSGYGKPDGQAVTYPSAIDHLLQETPIGKCRNLGGKLGNKIQMLLPENVPLNVGSIAKYISLPMLQQSLGSDESAHWVYDVVRGVDREPVVAKNDAALTKSITAFKSLPFRSDGHSFQDASTWIRLLAKEVVVRIEKDSARNHRYPRNCTIQYAQQGRQNKSVRTSFPPEHLSTEEKIDRLAQNVPNLVKAKEGNNFRFNRIGLCATEFLSREGSNQSIARFLIKGKSKEEHSCEVVNEPSRVENDVQTEDKETMEEADLELAKKMQAEFDRKDRLFQALERTASSRPPKTRKIDCFFKKK